VADAPAKAQNVSQPKVEEFSLDGRLSGTLDDAKQAIGNVPFYLIKKSQDSLDLIKVESRSINRRPYLFHIISIKADRIDITYSLVPDSSVGLRRAYVLKSIAAIISMLDGKYSVDQLKFVQYVDSVLDSLLSGLSQSYTTLYNRYDSLLTEYREIKRLEIEVSAANRNMAIQSAQLAEENKAISAQLNALKKYSDEALMALVEDWITTHNGSIDIVEFSKAHDVVPTRVEQVLDKMVSLGYLELKE
jgi:hypothetical protein